MKFFQLTVRLVIAALVILIMPNTAWALPAVESDRVVAAPVQSGMEYKIALNGDTYEVLMRPQGTPTEPNLTLTAQITIKVPHGTGADRFEIADFVNLTDGAEWSATSRIDAPSEDNIYDYISFTVAFPDGDHTVFNWAEGQAVKLFTFTNSGACLGPVALMENSDPFMAPNSANTNPGNQINVMGLGSDNAYAGNYDIGQARCGPMLVQRDGQIFLPLVIR